MFARLEQIVRKLDMGNTPHNASCAFDLLALLLDATDEELDLPQPLVPHQFVEQLRIAVHWHSLGLHLPARCHRAEKIIKPI